MTVINLLDKSKLRALESRCNSKEMAEHVMSFLTLTTLQRLPAFANDHFLHNFQDHLGTFRVLLDECRQIPNIFLPYALTETKTETDSEYEYEMETETETETEELYECDTASVRVHVVLERPTDVAWKVSLSHWSWEVTEPLHDLGNHNMTACSEDVRRGVSRACRVPCMVEMPTTPTQWLNFIRLWVFGQPLKRPLKQTKLHDFFMATKAS